MNLICPVKSGRQDSNLRPPAPKAGAIPGYATPRKSLLKSALSALSVALVALPLLQLRSANVGKCFT